MLHTNRPTQVRFPSRATIRTVFQTLIALAALAPVIISAVGLSATLPIVGGVLAVAAAITRVMAVPAVEAFLESHLPWLAARPAQAVVGDPSRHDGVTYTNPMPDNRR